MDDFVVEDGICIIRSCSKGYKNFGLTMDWYYLYAAGVPFPHEKIHFSRRRSIGHKRARRGTEPNVD